MAISHSHDQGAHSRRSGWFARPKDVLPSTDRQEAEVRERLYARPDANERTVERVGPLQRMADRPAA